MTGRPGLEVGKHGDIWTVANGRGGWQARTRVRDQDGRVREVTATGQTKGAAKRALEAKLVPRTPPTAHGVTPDLTLEQLGELWLEHRARSGRVKGAGQVKPQTLAAYRDALQFTVAPAMGGLRIRDCRVGRLDTLLGDLEETGVSTAQARSVLHQMFGLAVRHEALASNPMSYVTPTRRERKEVEVLSVDTVHLLRHVVSPEVRRQPGVRGPNGDLRDVIDGLLGTGCRIGELLALTWFHLDLDCDEPKVWIDGTLVEPKKGYVAKLHRQGSTKSGEARTLVLPDAVADMLRSRRAKSRFTGLKDPVFATRTGNWLYPNNIRTRLRTAANEYDELRGTTPHTLRRTVGTLITHERGLDDARAQLGHSDPSVTWQRYVAPREVAPDLRDLFDRFFVPSDGHSADLRRLAS